LLVWNRLPNRPALCWPFERGELLLDGLDVVFKGAAAANDPAELWPRHRWRVPDARNCNFTCAAGSAQGLAVVCLQGTAKARLIRCFWPPARI